MQALMFPVNVSEQKTGLGLLGGGRALPTYN